MSNDKHDGKHRDDTETCLEYNRYDIASLMIKLARRGPTSEEDREKILWCSYELCRSGFNPICFADICLRYLLTKPFGSIIRSILLPCPSIVDMNINSSVFSKAYPLRVR